MKKLHFLFLNGKENVYDEYIDVENEKSFSFQIENQRFKVQLDEQFSFFKEDDDTILEISNENVCSAKYILKDNKLEFDVKLSFLEYKNMGNKYIINYILESDENILKSIIFELS